MLPSRKIAQQDGEMRSLPRTFHAFLEVPTAEFSEDVCQVIRQEAIAGGVVLGPDLRRVPTRSGF